MKQNKQLTQLTYFGHCTFLLTRNIFIESQTVQCLPIAAIYCSIFLIFPFNHLLLHSVIFSFLVIFCYRLNDMIKRKNESNLSCYANSEEMYSYLAQKYLGVSECKKFDQISKSFSFLIPIHYHTYKSSYILKQN